MAEPADLPAPMVRAPARLHRHRAAWLRSHKVQQLRPAQLLTERNRPVRPRTVKLKAALRQTDPDDVNLVHGRVPPPGVGHTTTLAHLSMATENCTLLTIENQTLQTCGRTPRRGVGGVGLGVAVGTGLAQRPPRVWRRQPGYPQRTGGTVPVSVLAGDHDAPLLRRRSASACSRFW